MHVMCLFVGPSAPTDECARDGSVANPLHVTILNMLKQSSSIHVWDRQRESRGALLCWFAAASEVTSFTFNMFNSGLPTHTSIEHAVLHETNAHETRRWEN